MPSSTEHTAQGLLLPAKQQPLKVFELERFFAKYEFAAKHLLCCSDCQPLQLSQLLSIADEDSKKRWETLSLAYTESAGLPALRQEVTDMYEGAVTPDEVIVMAPEEAIFLAMTAHLHSGDRVIAMHPGYQSLHEVARSIGCHIDFWEPTTSANGNLHFDVDQLRSLLIPGTKMVVVNAPHNPTGWLPSHEEWREIVDACRAAGTHLFSDEMYRMLELEPADRLAPACELYDRAVTLSGMSKAFGLPGLRIGWLATKDAALLRRVAELHDFTTICSSAPSEVLALAGLRARDQLASDNIALVKCNIHLFEEFAARHPGTFAFQAPRAGSIAFPQLLTGEPVAELCDRCVRDSGVLLLPATVYAHAPSIEENRFRLGLGRADFPECLAALETYMFPSER